jgi:ribose-phosphate pyrophosphokinase
MNVIGQAKGPHLRDHGRHGRHRRHAGEGGQVLKEEGATKVMAYCTHAVLWPAVERIAAPTSARAGGHRHHPAARDARACKKIRSLSVAGLIAETICASTPRNR